jgi:hypothetical protein
MLQSTSASSSSAPSSSSIPSSTLQWKVLIYDIPGRSIISPLLSVSHLRSLGVTLHLLISTTRTAIPAVPAVYFLEPTEANIRQIALDAKNNLYGAGFHLNFTRKLPRALLELLGSLLVQYNCVNAIQSVVDRYLDFVALEPTLFTLNHKQSYSLIHGHQATEQSVNEYMETCVSSLTSLLSLYPGSPVIKTPTQGPANYLGTMLAKSLKDTPNPSARGTLTRPTLLILDRSDDVATSLMHSSTYQSLLADTLAYDSNRVKVPSDTGGTVSYDLDEEKDVFWRKAKFLTFPEAIEFHQEELKRITSAEEAIRNKTTSLSDDTKHLSDAVSSLPELLEQKKLLETHTHLLQQVMTQVSKRDIPVYFDLELKVMEGLKINAENVKKDVTELLQSSAENTELVKDKLRLVLICCLYLRLDKSEVEIYKATLITQASGDAEVIELITKSIDAARALAATREGFTVGSANTPPVSGGLGGGSRQSELLNKFTSSAISSATGLLATASAAVAGMAGRERTCRAARLVENVVANKEGLDLATFDPSSSSQFPETPATPVVIVFVLGGGGFEERRNLAKVRGVQSLVYGCTELAGGGLLEQLGSLA